MFDFFFKKKKIVLDCFTHKHYVHNFAKINYASKFYPYWWEKTIKSDDNNNVVPTIKFCDGLISFYNTGIVIPSWFSLVIDIGDNNQKEYNWRSSNNDFNDISHRYVQFKHFCLDNGFNFKIMSPWKFKTNRKINFVWSQPTWSIRNNLFNYCILPGVLNFKMQHSTHVNLFCQYDKEPKTINIEPLDPLVILHPLSDEEIIIKNHIVDENEYISICYIEEMMVFKNFSNIKNFIAYKKQRNNLYKKLEKLNGE